MRRVRTAALAAAAPLFVTTTFVVKPVFHWFWTV